MAQHVHPVDIAIEMMDDARDKIIELFMLDQELSAAERHVLLLMDNAQGKIEKDRNIEKLTDYLRRAPDISDYGQGLAHDAGLHVQTLREYRHATDPRPKIVAFPSGGKAQHG